MERTATNPSSPNDPPSAASPAPGPFSSLGSRVLASTLVVTLSLIIALTASGGFDTVAQRMMVQFNRFASVDAPTVRADTVEARPASTHGLTLSELPSHPSKKHQAYFSETVFDGSRPDSSLVRQFHQLLDLFTKRQGVDDNFTIRVLDDRTHEVLEVYVLEDMKAAYERGREYDWREVDDHRRRATRRLVDKWVDRGVPREDVTVRWGRATQIEKAHDRDVPFKEYEIRLAEYLDLSLLPTEIGTVETFNKDWLESPVGARSRYQMMPWILRRSGVNAYRLRTEQGNWIKIREEWHPLLTLQPAFTLLRGYINAVGHEIPGISAYHTGPGNIYKIYRLFFKKSQYFESDATVVDAYLWALTEGFDTVNEVSTFGHYSRGYVPSTYGSLVATENKTIDTTKTLRTARVQLEPGAQTSLRDILTVLDSTQTFDWGPGTGGMSIYEKFREINPHFDLPATDDGELPVAGNVRFVSSVDGKAVRFFLPLGAPAALRGAGLDVLNDDATFHFDGSTFSNADAQRTRWDRTYAELVDDIGRFGFTPSNRHQLLELHDKFIELADENPSHYRRLQLDIIQTHRRIWLSNPWEELSDESMLATGRVRMPVQPPVALQTDSLRRSPFQPSP